MTASPGRAVSLDVLRAALHGAAERSSYRSVAREVGLSARALHMFVTRESLPRARTVHRLRQWYFRHSAGVHVTEDDAAAAIRILLHGLTGQHAARAFEVCLSLVERAYADSGLPRPAWIDTLRSRGVDGLK
jgi:hypothetical protein